MIQRILSSKNFVACLLAAVMGMALYFKLPFPAENDFLQLMALQAPFVHEGLFYSYNHFLFTTPYIAYLIVLSGLYVFGLTLHKKIRVGELPPYPEATQIYHVDDFKLSTPKTIIETAKTHMKEEEGILMAMSANQNAIGHLPSLTTQG